MRELFLGGARRGEAAERYAYYLIVDEMDVGAFSCESYGLRVVDRTDGSEASVPHITCSIPRIDALCDLVLDGAVSPAHLADVVRDWL